MFKEYDKKVKNILSSNSNTNDWAAILEDHTTKISQIQHERLIHLLVTIFVGIAALLCILTTLITLMRSLIYLDILLLILFLAYIFHYRFLENTTQNWYKIGDRIKENTRTQ